MAVLAVALQVMTAVAYAPYQQRAAALQPLITVSRCRLCCGACVCLVDVATVAVQTVAKQFDVELEFFETGR
jgi:hypothetical protein